MKLEEDRESPSIVLGNLPVNSVSATVLFYSGATHSFVSQTFAQLHGFPTELLTTPLEVHAVGSQSRATMVSPNTAITMGDLLFHASPIVLKSSNIDVILGMDWLEAHDAHIHCATKTVQLTHPSGQIILLSPNNSACRKPDICSVCFECFTS